LAVRNFPVRHSRIYFVPHIKHGQFINWWYNYSFWSYIYITFHAIIKQQHALYIHIYHISCHSHSLWRNWFNKNCMNFNLLIN